MATLTTTSPTTRRTGSAASLVMPVAAAAALLAGPVLWSAGMFTSPQTDSMADADYIASLARDKSRSCCSRSSCH